jgi:hypothetical protein
MQLLHVAIHEQDVVHIERRGLMQECMKSLFLGFVATQCILTLQRACRILPDTASHEVNRLIEAVSLICRSAQLNPSATYEDTLDAFFAHFPSVDFFSITMSNDPADYDDENLSFVNRGSLSMLLPKLQPIAAVLSTLRICGSFKYRRLRVLPLC